ncbi:IPT/TIG domain-containing protein [Streptomyces sp. NPDC047022]|uniref:IPT/TIG domain-containing protein n=1 Tax=Streptomyces sp. NPDC047022 TaxID=3155737 RepID=UPI00340AE7D6
MTTAGGTSNPKPFFYYPNGFIDSITPGAGPVAGRNTITLQGQELSTATQVLFGTARAIPAVVSDNQLTVTVPPATRTGVVSVASGRRHRHHTRRNGHPAGRLHLHLRGPAHLKALRRSG